MEICTLIVLKHLRSQINVNNLQIYYAGYRRIEQSQSSLMTLKACGGVFFCRDFALSSISRVWDVYKKVGTRCQIISSRHPRDKAQKRHHYSEVKCQTKVTGVYKQ